MTVIMMVLVELLSIQAQDVTSVIFDFFPKLEIKPRVLAVTSSFTVVAWNILQGPVTQSQNKQPSLPQYVLPCQAGWTYIDCGEIYARVLLEPHPAGQLAGVPLTRVAHRATLVRRKSKLSKFSVNVAKHCQEKEHKPGRGCVFDLSEMFVQNPGRKAKYLCKTLFFRPRHSQLSGSQKCKPKPVCYRGVYLFKTNERLLPLFFAGGDA